VAAEAVKLIESDHLRFESEAAVLRQRLATVQSEITSLINSLKAVGGNGGRTAPDGTRSSPEGAVRPPAAAAGAVHRERTARGGNGESS
jgi:hypothetical protein